MDAIMIKNSPPDFNLQRERSIAEILACGPSMPPSEFPTLPAHLARRRDSVRRLADRIRNLDGEVVLALAERLAEPLAELIGQILGERDDT
jgi:hypothetical protein